ncbi:MAG TPA: zf-HC2 domain-containing protein [Gammaproteobacteria bacterium]|jgi:anti-sigma factor RsiW
MNCEQTTELLSDRLKGLLSPEDEQQLEAHLASCAACGAEADAIAALWAGMGEIADDVPHERMRMRFHAALAAYEERMRTSGLDALFERIWPRRPALQAAFATVLLLVGVVVGQQLTAPSNSEIDSLRAEVRTVGIVLLGHQSAAERLRGVEWARRTDSDAEVVAALLETARHDANLNVRLAAVDALSDWLDRPQVGAGLTAALEQEDAPLMQVTLASRLLEGGVEGSTAAVTHLLEREELDPLVRDYLNMALEEAGNATPRPEV